MVGPLAQEFASKVSKDFTIAIRYDMGRVTEAPALPQALAPKPKRSLLAVRRRVWQHRSC